MREFVGFDGFHQTRYVHLDNAIVFSNGALLSTALNVRREGLQEPFEIADGVIIPTATYDFLEGLVRFNTNESAVWSVNGRITFGGFFSGHRQSIEATLTNRIGTTWVAALRLIHDNVDLTEGDFENTLVGLRLAYSFSPRIFVQSLLQYNDQDDEFAGNVRFGWLNTAGTGLYVVFNEVQQTSSPAGPLDRAIIVKFTKQFGVLQ